MPAEANRVAETSTTTGTGSLTLGGAVGGHQTFLAAFGSGSTAVHYGIVMDGTGEWEEGIGTYIGSSNLLTRDTVLDSSDGGGAVSFGAGTKVVYVPHPAYGATRINITRPGDIGLDVYPASGQTAKVLRIDNGSGGNSWDVSSSGSMRTGRVDIVASEPTLQLSDSDQTLPAGRWRLRGSGGDVYVDLPTSGNFTTYTSIMKFDGGNADVSFMAGTDGLTISPATAEIRELAGTLPMRYVTDNNHGHQFYLDGGSTEAARVTGAGTSLSNAVGIVTREKGDARYAAISSRRFKPDAAPTGPVDLSGLALNAWTWGGELEPTHPRFGQVGSGFIAEEVDKVLPSAVTRDSKGKIHGLDAASLVAHAIGHFARENAELRARIEALEKPRTRKTKPKAGEANG